MIARKTSQQVLLLLLGSIASLSAGAGQAPDAGQTTRELQQEQNREIKKPKAIPPLDTEGGASTAPSVVDNTQIPVKAIHVTGSTVYSAAVLEALVADMVGGTHSLTELELAAARISTHYRKHGYFLSSAYLPAQDIKDGVLEIAVLEGKVDQITLNNTSRVSDKRIHGHLEKVSAKQSPMDRKLLLLRDSIGMSSLRAVLQPGASVGTSDLLIETTSTAPYNGSVQVDNYGNRYTGEYRVNAAIAINSPLKIGDQLTARVIGSDRDMVYGRAAYQLPIGGDGLRVGAALARIDYQLGREFKSLDAHGTATSASLFTTYPFIMSQNGSLVGAMTYEDKNLKDFIDSTNTDNKKSVQSGTLGLTGNYQDGFNGAGQTSFDVSWTLGHLSMDAVQRVIDEATARSNGDFTKVGYTFNRLQRVTDNNTLSASISGQWAGDNLNSSDKFSLGGSYGVRAYPQGEGSGDEGSLLNLELRHRFMPQLQGVVFYDYGHVKINHNQYAVGDNTRTIAGAGFGVNAEVFKKIRVDGYLAWRTQGGTPLSEPASSERSPRLWVQAGFEF
ncbi:MAG: ShlB/FhaC/HecB family hemolysin secretion/activation protein [Methylotenera sp.]